MLERFFVDKRIRKCYISSMTTKTTTYAACQIAYFAALAAYENACAEFSARTAGVDWNDYDAADELCETVRAELRIDALSTAKIQAEEVMLDWARDVALRIARTPEQRADVRVATNRGRLSPAIRPRLIDAAARLVA